MSDLSKGRPRRTVALTAGAFPLDLFKEWDADCKEKFGGLRWMKIWNDHIAAQSVDIFRVLLEEIERLKSRIDSLEGKEQKEQKKSITLGGVTE